MDSKTDKLKKKYKFIVMDTNVAVKCSTQFKNDFYKWCRKNKVTPTEVIREFMFECLAKK